MKKTEVQNHLNMRFGLKVEFNRGICMSSLMDVKTAAQYNKWANNRIYNSLKQLSDEERKKDRKAFFKSIHNTLNHILLADLLYRQRIEKKPITFKALDEIIHSEFVELEKHHRKNDIWYENYCSQLTPVDLKEEFPFEAVGLSEREFFSLSLGTCLTNLFQHQIHHRGQIHHMISHASMDPPPVDVVKFARGDKDKWTV